MAADITAILLTKNEEVNIEECIKSIITTVKRIVVIDSFSTDKTVEIAKRMGAEVYQHPFENYAKQYMYGVEVAKAETVWTLRIDADERLTPDSANELTQLCDSNMKTDVTGIVLRFKKNFLGKDLYHGGVYPYVTRILQVENIGKINFSGSVVSYFTLLAGLGISTYAIREGAGLRQDKHKFEIFSNEVFTINIISSMVSYALFVCMLIAVQDLHPYIPLILIQSIGIVGPTVGVPLKKEKQIMYATFASAIINLLLNFIFIPLWKQTGAAITTVVAEIVVMLWQVCAYKKSNHCIELRLNKSNLKAIFIACCVIILICVSIDTFQMKFIVAFSVKVILSIISYIIILVVLHHTIVLKVIEFIRNCLKK